MDKKIIARIILSLMVLAFLVILCIGMGWAKFISLMLFTLGLACLVGIFIWCIDQLHSDE